MGIFSPGTLTLSPESPLLHSQLTVLPFTCVTIIKHHELCSFDKSISHSFAKLPSAGLVPGDRKFFHRCYWSLSSPGEGPVSCFATCFIRTLMAQGKIYSNNRCAVCPLWGCIQFDLGWRKYKHGQTSWEGSLLSQLHTH